jgi:hypothetical protein
LPTASASIHAANTAIPHSSTNDLASGGIEMLWPALLARKYITDFIKSPGTSAPSPSIP